MRSGFLCGRNRRSLPLETRARLLGDVGVDHEDSLLLSHLDDLLRLLVNDVRIFLVEDHLLALLNQLRHADKWLVDGCELEHELAPCSIHRHKLH